jgi:glycerophosphoryl diester phosphodiesterase
LKRVIGSSMLAALLCANAATGIEYDDDYLKPDRLEKFLAEKHQGVAVQLGSRPKYLIGDMAPGGLQRQLAACENHSAHATDFSIAHRGAPLRFAEHTLESYVAAARQGAGIVECDVTFTRDRELVCRHSQCDLHTTTNILQIPELAAKCSQPFTPYDPATNTPASARCCTSDITLREFKSLQGKIDAANPRATTVDEYLSTAATAGWRSDSYSAFSCSANSAWA